MNFTLFNKICLDDIVWNSQNSHWREVIHETERSRILYANNHPLVSKKVAFWRTDKIIVLGYQLISDSNIYRPIYSNSLNKHKKAINNSIKDKIGKGTNGFMRRLRMNLASTELLGISTLAIDNIKYIVQFL
jgi:hypothetical protein